MEPDDLKPGSTDASAQAAREITAEFDVPAEMRDGTVLRANVYRPDKPGPWPILLTRTPYSKDDPGMDVWSGVNPIHATRRGFIVVVQDVRGRFTSDGQWEPYRHEGRDGYDSVEWAARLPGSNGRVGMYSASYCANAQWLAAFEGPPSLAAISPAMTWSEPNDGLLERGGAVELGVSLRWALENGFDLVERRSASADERCHSVESLIEDWDRLEVAGYWSLPVSDAEVLRRNRVPDLGGIAALDNPAIAEWSRVAGNYQRVSVPSLHTAGWYDLYLQGTLDNYQGMVGAGLDARLVVGPWTHHAFSDPIGEHRFGLLATRDSVPGDHQAWGDLQLRWFRRQLVPGSAEELPDSPVRIFVMGRNVWREESEWPLRRAVQERWYLGGDGSLAPDRTEAGNVSSVFAYDPNDPTPAVGGQGVISPGFPSGPFDQRDVETRRDVLVFSSDPLRDDLEATGPIRVVLHADSSAPSTDWVARLCDVYPDGRSINLCDGILRVATRANECRRYELDLWSTSNVFLRGHRVRIDVTSSTFPRWDRNLNTGNQRESSAVVAQQRIFHDEQRPSYVELPIIR